MSKVKFFHTKQIGKYDCGIACASSVYRYYGYDYSVDYLSDYLPSENRYSLREMVILLSIENHLKTRIVEVDKNRMSEVLENIKFPFISLCSVNNQGHYVVVYEWNSKTNKLKISDPSNEGITNISLSQFQKMSNGIFLLIEGQFSSVKSESSKSSFFILIKDIVRNNLLSILFSFLISVIIVILAIVGSFYFKLVVDYIIPRSLDNFIFQLCLVFVGVVLLHGLFIYLRGKLIIKLSNNLDKSLSNKYFEKLIKLKINFFENRADGEVISRFNDVSFIRGFISVTFVSALLDFVIVLSLGFIIYKFNSILFIVLLAFILILGALTVLFYGSIQVRSRDLMLTKAETNSYLVHFLKFMPTIFSLNKKKYFINRFQGVFGEQLKALLKDQKNDNLFSTCKFLVQGIFFVVFISIGAQQIIADSLTLGDLLFINSLVSFMMGSLEGLLTLQSDFQKAVVSVSRYTDILKYPERKLSEHKLNLEHVNTININDLSYQFPNNKTVFEEVDLNVNAGDKVVCVGESGAGKSTFAKLIVGLYESKPNQIRINGKDITDYSEESLRKEMMLIGEAPFLFKGSIRENLVMGENISDGEILNACRLAECLEIIETLPGGLDYLITENGTNLSSGQRQRLAYARLILLNPSVIILDEALSNVDEVSLKRIYDHMIDMKATIIYITHNTNLIEQFDRKIIFKDRRIYETVNRKDFNYE
ncbi:peptidase domain-containing ABC transporter [Paenibacillus amylolyticus]|uniref:Peptidase domain-containing ABC transporter n=1 Tax=Paenibacillus amylolyticus TaxID=1451 RepID=A0A5M9WYK0_PAEAM|nr:peptidase domain-containing ABC transporter [Paenibacillus amylolyticus]KAA8786655.1 peptidase domain-containing ABC transporter [Paenibacillus amylolyticus]